MTSYRPKFHREARFEAISEWSRQGVLVKRKSLPIEEQFLARVRERGGDFFLPLELKYSDNLEFNKQVAYIVDAYDALPSRVDIAFDSTWKALESAISGGPPGGLGTTNSQGNSTMKLRYLAEEWRSAGPTIDKLLLAICDQSCEYLYSRLLLGSGQYSPPYSGKFPRSRLLSNCQSKGEQLRFLTVLDSTYGIGSSATRKRNGAMFVRRALQGERLTVSDGELALNLDTRSHLLLSGLMYSMRNERFHGESFSPFISSAATLKTYTHPFYAFICAYSLVHLVWASSDVNDAGITLECVMNNVEHNLELAMRLFGRHWH